MPENTVYDEKVLILLATYNGEEFLQQQLDSITSQSFSKWELIIRDDNSTDATREVISEWIAGLKGSHVRFEQASDTSLHGALANFSTLCDLALESDAKYYCFCDQDDIWHSDKLETMVSRLAQLETHHGTDCPLLVHSDLQVVDSFGKLISPSFIHYQGLPDPNRHSLQKLQIQNNVTGCASLFNRALLELATPVPVDIAIHDWWIALCAESTGKIEFIEHPLVDYRQHRKNLVGAKSRSVAKNPLHRHFYRILYSFPGHLEKSLLQNQLIQDRLKTRSIKIPQEKLDHLVRYSGLRSHGYINRVKTLNRTLNTRNEFLGFLYLAVIALFYPRDVVRNSD